MGRNDLLEVCEDDRKLHHSRYIETGYSLQDHINDNSLCYAITHFRVFIILNSIKFNFCQLSGRVNSFNLAICLKP